MLMRFGTWLGYKSWNAAAFVFFTAQINFALEENVAKEGHLKWLWIMFFSIGLRTLKKQLLHKCKPQGRLLCLHIQPLSPGLSWNVSVSHSQHSTTEWAWIFEDFTGLLFVWLLIFLLPNSRLCYVFKIFTRCLIFSVSPSLALENVKRVFKRGTNKNPTELLFKQTASPGPNIKMRRQKTFISCTVGMQFLPKTVQLQLLSFNSSPLNFRNIPIKYILVTETTHKEERPKCFIKPIILQTSAWLILRLFQFKLSFLKDMAICKWRHRLPPTSKICVIVSNYFLGHASFVKGRSILQVFYKLLVICLVRWMYKWLKSKTSKPLTKTTNFIWHKSLNFFPHYEQTH